MCIKHAEEPQRSTLPHGELSWYLQDLANTPTLSLKEEEAVSQQIAAAPYSAEAEAARTLLIEAHLRLVVRLAHCYQPFGPALADLVQEGNLALVKAARQFNPQRSQHFRVFARQRIAWAIYRVIKEYLQEHYLIDPEAKIEPIHPLREAVVKALAHAAIDEQALIVDLPEPRCVSLDLLLTSEDTDALRPDDSSYAHAYYSQANSESDPDEIYLAQERSLCIAFCLTTLNARERFVLTQRFLLDETLTLEQIGQTLGVTREMVRQIEVRSLRKLRHPPLARMLCSVL